MSAILCELNRRSKRSISSQMNLILFRVSACAGLRVAECADLQLRDIVLTDVRPHLVVRNGKGHKKRKVPLWLDRSTLGDIAAWKAFRTSQGAISEDSFICHLRTASLGQPLTTRSLQYRFKTLLAMCLASERVRQLSIHSGRHSFCSHILRRGFNLIEVRDWMGHSDLRVTSLYAHIDPDQGSEIGDAFAF